MRRVGPVRSGRTRVSSPPRPRAASMRRADGSGSSVAVRVGGAEPRFDTRAPRPGGPRSDGLDVARGRRGKPRLARPPTVAERRKQARLRRASDLRALPGSKRAASGPRSPAFLAKRQRPSRPLAPGSTDAASTAGSRACPRAFDAGASRRRDRTFNPSPPVWRPGPATGAPRRFSTTGRRTALSPRTSSPALRRAPRRAPRGSAFGLSKRSSHPTPTSATWRCGGFAPQGRHTPLHPAPEDRKAPFDRVRGDDRTVRLHLPLGQRDLGPVHDRLGRHRKAPLAAGARRAVRPQGRPKASKGRSPVVRGGLKEGRSGHGRLPSRRKRPARRAAPAS